MLSCSESQPYAAQTAVRFAFPSLGVTGSCASRLTVDDVRQIRELARNRPDIKKPVDQIDIDHPDQARVSSGNAQNPGDVMTTFEVRKKNGRWIIIKGSAGTGEAVITS